MKTLKRTWPRMSAVIIVAGLAEYLPILIIVSIGLALGTLSACLDPHSPSPLLSPSRESAISSGTRAKIILELELLLVGLVCCALILGYFLSSSAGESWLRVVAGVFAMLVGGFNWTTLRYALDEPADHFKSEV